MRKAFLISTFLAFCVTLSLSREYGQGHPIPPGVREADKQTNAPIEPPAKFKQQRTNPATLEQEAKELAKLSAAVPPQINQVNQGQIPKDLADQLKRIEKLAKHLRSEISQ